MLKKCETVLLISNQPAFFEPYRKLAESIGVRLFTESEWNKKYRVKEDLVILGSKHLDELNELYYSRAVVILGTGESPAPYIKLGISRFIFDYKNNYELIVALFREEPIVINTPAREVAVAVADSGSPSFCYKDYDFKFSKDVYFYKGRQVYFQKAQKRYLAEWLLIGNKDNNKRMILCNLRKKFGAEFLSDIDRFGQPIGGKDE